MELTKLVIDNYCQRVKRMDLLTNRVDQGEERGEFSSDGVRISGR